MGPFGIRIVWLQEAEQRGRWITATMIAFSSRPVILTREADSEQVTDSHRYYRPLGVRGCECTAAGSRWKVARHRHCPRLPKMPTHSLAHSDVRKGRGPSVEHLGGLGPSLWLRIVAAWPLMWYAGRASNFRESCATCPEGAISSAVKSHIKDAAADQ